MNSLYSPLTTDSFWCYLWSDRDDECKFGDTWVKAGINPWDKCVHRIRESVGVNKDRFDSNEITIHSIWNVSDIAKEVGRFRKHGKIDDYIRNEIPNSRRKGVTGDKHKIPGEKFKIMVNKWIMSRNQPLPECELSTMQYVVAEELTEKFKGKEKRILAELCARFGKTILAGVVGVELKKDLIIVASYVDTVLTSFMSDLSSFQQFADYEHIDMRDKNSETLLGDKLFNEGKKVIAYLSLRNGSKRQNRIDAVHWQNCDSMLIVDEADFGAHTKNQALPLIEAQDTWGKIDTLIMTGTNADRAVTHWKVDDMISVTYPELLIQKSKVLNNVEQI